MTGGWSYSSDVHAVRPDPLLDEVRSSMSHHGHSQERLVEILESMEAPHRSQASMSRYLAGLQSVPPEVRSGFSRYLDTFPAPSFPGTTPTPDGPVADDQDFEGSVRGLSGEPLLGPRQAALVDSAIARLAQGPPMSDDDRRTFEDLRRIVGLSD